MNFLLGSANSPSGQKPENKILESRSTGPVEVFRCMVESKLNVLAINWLRILNMLTMN